MKIIHRNNLPQHPSRRYAKRAISDIKYIVVHHFAGWISIEQAAEYHVSKGWPGIGYWAVIDTDGSLNICHDLDTKSYNVGNNNTKVLGIALRGNYTAELPEQCMLDTLKETIKMVTDIIGKREIRVHSDFTATECPGSELRNYVRAHFPYPQALNVRDPWYKKLFQKDPDHLDS